MDLEIILAILGLGIGLIGIVPVLLDFDRYREKLGFSFTRESLKIDFLQITFDVKSITEVKVFCTGKYSVISDAPLLEMPFRNIFGDTDKLKVKIDNKLIKPEIVSDGEEVKGVHRLTEKNKGDTFTLDFEVTFTGDLEKVNKSDDGVGFWTNYYRCKQLKLQVIFPRHFYPINVRFVEGDSDFRKEKKERFGMIKLPTLCAANRRQVEWLIDYPKYKKGYWMRWSWGL